MRLRGNILVSVCIALEMNGLHFEIVQLDLRMPLQRIIASDH